MDQNELPLEPRHLVIPSGASKMISEPMVRLVQSMHLSCTDADNTSKRKEERFHITHVTKVFHRVHPKWFPSLWYVRRKPCTYLASRLVLWYLSWAHVTKELHRVYANWFPEPMLCSTQTVHLSCIKISTISKRTEMSFHLSLVPSGSSFQSV